MHIEEAYWFEVGLCEFGFAGELLRVRRRSLSSFWAVVEPSSGIGGRPEWPLMVVGFFFFGGTILMHRLKMGNADGENGWKCRTHCSKEDIQYNL